MKILVIGSHGKVGKHLVRILAQKGHSVRAMIRNLNQETEMIGLGGNPFVADLEGDFSAAYSDIEAVVFTAGSGSQTGPDKTISVDQEAAIKSIDLAVQKGISRYIMVSAQGARDPELPSPIQHYFRAKKVADDYLMKSGLDYTIFRPGRLLDQKGAAKVWLGETREEKGQTCRNDLAMAVALSMEKENTFKKIIELFVGDDDLEKTITSFK